ncbi:MAG: hypothetical protein LBI42_14545 [Chitinispirillales bacterium]|jgi:hypothetical protein|nr:hypothetical protein [Chitinispirillales bacterium]
MIPKMELLLALYRKWMRLGVGFSGTEPALEEPYLEELIAETSLIGRYDSRLIEGMAGWIQEHGDLINMSLMQKNIKLADSAVLGLISDLVAGKEAQKFKKIAKYCTPKSQPEMLFYGTGKSEETRTEAVKSETAVNRRWNLYYVDFKIKNGVVFQRNLMLKLNHNLARRALFGAEMRTEILNFLLNKRQSFPAQIARSLGYRYHRVMEDVHTLLRNGALVQQEVGRKKEITIAQPFMDYLKQIPF